MFSWVQPWLPVNYPQTVGESSMVMIFVQHRALFLTNIFNKYFLMFLCSYRSHQNK